MKKFAAIAFILILICSTSFAYQLTATRDEMLNYYYAAIDSKLPKSIKMLVGDEKANVYIGGKVLGIETRGGELKTFETTEVENPGIIIRISDFAAEKISQKQSGVLTAIDSGEITIETKGWYTTFKVEVIKRLYAVSKLDDVLLGKKNSGATQGGIYNSAYAQRVRIVNSICFWC
ncbi:MAG: hypothetical protein NTV88_04970 [Candidatus Micrarchaeota archaeon]|nr:hypothetical protein [Candidatus Micrarchaeota archaeon]